MDAIRSRPDVQAAGPNQRRTIGPFDPVEAQEFADELSTFGYDLGGVPINGVAPGATVIPVKVLCDGGSGGAR